MSHVIYDTMGNAHKATSVSHYLNFLCRLLVVMASMLVVVLLSLTYGANRSPSVASLNVGEDNTLRYSPLQGLLNKDQNLAAHLLFALIIKDQTEILLEQSTKGSASWFPPEWMAFRDFDKLLSRGTACEDSSADPSWDSDCDMMEKINKQSTLELKTLVIAETVVPYDDRELLSTYVKQQLDASDVISDGQKEAVLTMVNLAPMEASVNKEDIGEKGTLRNSAVLALIKRHLNNVHFLLIGVRAEPRLGWNWIASSERNAWNDVLSRVLADKVRVEAKNYLWQRDIYELPNSPEPASKDQ